MVGWKCIGLALKRGAGDTRSLLERVLAILLENTVEVVLDSVAAEQLDQGPGLPLDDVASRAEVLIALGGDGTVLATTRAIGVRRVPILGVNLGRLGFLADVNPDEVDEALQALFRGSYSITERSRLEVTLLHERGEELVGLVLNDAILATAGDVARMIELETRVDGHLVSSYQADGLILSTPTGSTAYNLSAGGPLLDTTVAATILTPICPHALSQRPLVLSDELAIEVRLRSHDDVHLTLDGQVGKVLHPGEGIRVHRSEHPALFLTIPGHSRFETLRSKLGWGIGVIRQLRVENLAVIDELDVELGPGLNVLTGETGAGKSVLLSAVAMLCGRRVSAEAIRTGETQASVEAILDSPLLADRAVELGFADAESEARELLVARTLSARGRGKVFVNGRLSTVTLLAELMADVLEVVSQGEHQRLLRPEVQTELVDACGGLQPLAEQVRERYRSWHAVAAELHDRVLRREERARREDQLRFEIEQIERVAPRPGELDELEREHARLAHVDRLAQLVSSALETLQAEGGAGEGLVLARGAVSDAAQLDPDLEEAADGLRRAEVELEEAILALQRYGAALEADPGRLAAVEGRLGEIGRLRARYGAEVEEILAHRDRAREELERIGGGEARVQELERELAEAARALSARAARLDKARRQAGDEIAAAVQKELRGLELGKAEFQVRFERLSAKTPEGWEAPSGPRGSAVASFVFSANPGEEPRRLRDVASGGELSRLLLAVRNVLRDADAGRILLFDEIDAGVGGRSARRVGERLRTLGRVHQILCITHLAAIAALGETHYNVQKRTRGGRTVTAIGPLVGEARVDEIARLSGGGRVTDAARAHARELLSSR